MNIIYYDEIVNPDAEKHYNAFYTDFNELLRKSDFISLHVPLTPKTEKLIGDNELNLMKSTAYLINTSRGKVIDQTALIRALKSNRIAGAALDVWYNYRPEPDEDGRKFPSNYPFYELDNVILSPHRGASPMSDLKRWDEVIENISRMAKRDTNFINKVNLDLEY